MVIRLLKPICWRLACQKAGEDEDEDEEGSDESDASDESDDDEDDDEDDLRKSFKKVADKMRPDLAAGWERLKQKGVADE